jgi:hypothetical protein
MKTCSNLHNTYRASCTTSVEQWHVTSLVTLNGCHDYTFHVLLSFTRPLRVRQQQKKKELSCWCSVTSAWNREWVCSVNIFDLTLNDHQLIRTIHCQSNNFNVMLPRIEKHKVFPVGYDQRSLIESIALSERSKHLQAERWLLASIDMLISENSDMNMSTCRVD